MKTENEYNLGYLTYYRNYFYAISILLIMLFHTTIPFDKSVFMLPVRFVKDIGNIGVDIFMLLSGIFLYYSKYKSCWGFYKKRLIRVYLPFLMINIPWYAFVQALSATQTVRGGGILKKHTRYKLIL